MRWLLDLKGDPRALNADRMSPLACAVFKNCAGTTELLLQADPSTLKIHDANGDLPLHLALLEGSAAALQVLLNYGADWFECNERGETSFDLYKTVLQSGSVQGDTQQLVQVLLIPLINVLLMTIVTIGTTTMKSFLQCHLSHNSRLQLLACLPPPAPLPKPPSRPPRAAVCASA
jgi:hypothetical protein